MGQPQRTIADIVILKPTAAENEAVRAAIEAATTVGAKLAGARSARGLTLQEAHVATKVKVAQLAAIEAGDRSLLPAVPFTAGFVKAYAQFLGLDPDEYARAYKIEVGAAPKPETPAETAVMVDPAPAIAPPANVAPVAVHVPAVSPAPRIAAPVVEPVAEFSASPVQAPVAAPAPDRFALYVGAAAGAICAVWMGASSMNANRPAPAPVAIAGAAPNPPAVESAPAPVAPAAVEEAAANETAGPLTGETNVEDAATAKETVIAAIAPPSVKPRPKPKPVAEETPPPVIIAPEPVAPSPAPVEQTVVAAPAPYVVAATLSRPASPKYPERCSRGAAPEERVAVVFDITVEGRPTNLAAADSSNACFVDSAIETVGRMRFTPRTSNSDPVMEFGKRVTVRFAR